MGAAKCNKAAEASAEQSIQLINAKTTQNKSHLWAKTAERKNSELEIKGPHPAPVDKVFWFTSWMTRSSVLLFPSALLLCWSPTLGQSNWLSLPLLLGYLLSTGEETRIVASVSSCKQMCSASPRLSSLVGTFLCEDLQRAQAPGIPLFMSSKSALDMRDLNLTCHHWRNVCIYSCLIQVVLHAAATGISLMAPSTTPPNPSLSEAFQQLLCQGSESLR